MLTADAYRIGFDAGRTDGSRGERKRPRPLPWLTLLSTKYLTEYNQGYRAGYIMGCKARAMDAARVVRGIRRTTRHDVRRAESHERNRQAAMVRAVGDIYGARGYVRRNLLRSYKQPLIARLIGQDLIRYLDEREAAKVVNTELRKQRYRELQREIGEQEEERER